MEGEGAPWLRTLRFARVQIVINKRSVRSLFVMTVGAVVVVVFFTWFFGSIFSLFLAVLLGLIGIKGPDVEALQYVGYAVVGGVATWAYLKTLGKWWSELPEDAVGKVFVGRAKSRNAVDLGETTNVQKLASAIANANAHAERENKDGVLVALAGETKLGAAQSSEIVFHCPNCGKESRVQRSQPVSCP